MNRTTGETVIIGTSLQLILGLFNDYLMAYCIPIEVIITIINNYIMIVILTKRGPIRNKLGKTVRIYYLAIALGDTNTALSSYLSYFLGIVKLCSFRSFRNYVNAL